VVLFRQHLGEGRKPAEKRAEKKKGTPKKIRNGQRRIFLNEEIGASIVKRKKGQRTSEIGKNGTWPVYAPQDAGVEEQKKSTDWKRGNEQRGNITEEKMRKNRVLRWREKEKI